MGETELDIIAKEYFKEKFSKENIKRGVKDYFAEYIPSQIRAFALGGIEGVGISHVASSRIFGERVFLPDPNIERGQGLAYVSGVIAGMSGTFCSYYALNPKSLWIPVATNVLSLVRNLTN